MPAHDIVLNFMSAHNILNNFAERLGFHPGSGMCHGYSLRWLEACFLNEENLFHARIKKILLKPRKLDNLIKSINEVKRKKTSLTPADKELLDILSFFDSVVLYHRSDKFTSLFDSPFSLNQSYIQRVSSLAASDKIQALGGLVTLYSDVMIADEAEIAIYLNELSTLLDQVTLIPKKPFGILFKNHNHAITMTYQVGRGWKFMDINQYPSIEAKDVNILAKKLVNGFKEHPTSSYIAFGVSLISTLHNCNPILKAQLNQFKKGQPVSAEIALRAEQVNLAWIAARNGEVDRIKDLGRYNADLNRPNLGGFSPIWMASQHGHLEAIRVLIQLGVKITPDLATVAAKNGHLAVITEFAQQGLDFSTDGNAVFAAAAGGFFDVILELVKHGANVKLAGSCPIASLRTFAKQGNVADRMETFISYQLTKNNSPESIAISPYDIALIMNNQAMMQFLTQLSGPKTPCSPHARKSQDEAISKLSNFLRNFKLQSDLLYDKAMNNSRYKEISQIVRQLYQTIEWIHLNLIAKGAELTGGELSQYKEDCEAAIAKAKPEFKNDTDTWSRIHPIIKGILFLLASVTIIPAIIFAITSKHGYIGTFFNEPVTGMPEQLEIFEKLKTKISKIGK